MKKIVTVALLAVLSTGCATQTYLISGKNTSDNAEPQYDKMQTFFVSGIGQEKEVNASEICGGAHKVAKVETKLSLLNGVLGSVTSGIYTPRQMKVYCK